MLYQGDEVEIDRRESRFAKGMAQPRREDHV